MDPRKLFNPVLFGLLLAAECAVATEVRPADADTGIGVGFTRAVTADPMGGDLQYAIWYPAAGAGGITRVGPYEFAAATDAEPAPGRTGMVVLSHGSGGTPFGHRNVAIALARAGLIAVAPLHPRDNFRDSSGTGRRIVWDGRPRQVSAVIDAMLRERRWASRIDPNRIGAFGFSQGGYTVLALLGAEPDLRELIRHCDINATADPLCARAGGLAMAMRRIVADEYADPDVSLADKRVCAAVVADPVAAIFPDSAIEQIGVASLRIYLPETENELAASFHGARVARLLEGRGGIQVSTDVVGFAQHYSFIAPFPAVIASTLPESFADAPEFDAARFHRRFERQVVDYFARSLARCGA